MGRCQPLIAIRVLFNPTISTILSLFSLLLAFALSSLLVCQVQDLHPDMRVLSVKQVEETLQNDEEFGHIWETSRDAVIAICLEDVLGSVSV